jgi:hypothetical protein
MFCVVAVATNADLWMFHDRRPLVRATWLPARAAPKARVDIEACDAGRVVITRSRRRFIPTVIKNERW